MLANQRAIVLKNYLQQSYKVVLFHETLGKITCVYHKKNAATLLCSGSIVVCSLEQHKNWYRFASLEILFVPMNASISKLVFSHNIIRLCLKLLPFQIAAHELFVYLMYVYQNLDKLSSVGEQIVLLKIFVLFDMSPGTAKLYDIVQQDPCQIFSVDRAYVQGVLQSCWNHFDREFTQ